MNYDAWREVINGPETYAGIAAGLRTGTAVIVGWTDQSCTHFDILFTLRPAQHGGLQGGLRGATDLFVSVMRTGCFGFDVRNAAPLHHGYIAEKLHIAEASFTATALADLINGVVGQLNAEE